MKKLILVFFMLFSCLKIKGFETIELNLNGEIFNIKLAETDQQKTRGLMNRKVLKKNNGMLFIYENEQKLSYWMKNTYIPLSIAYISKDGTILEIYDMEPLSLKSIKSKYSVKYALELNKDRFKELNIKEGFKLDLDSLSNI